MERNNEEKKEQRLYTAFFICCIVFWFIIGLSLIGILYNVIHIWDFLKYMGYG